MAIIKNYGFMWDRDHVKRGKGENLIGTAAQRSAEVDFAEQIGVYALHDDHSNIVYIGQAGNGNANLLKRLKNHMDSGQLWNRWQFFSWVGFRDVNKGTNTLSNQQDPNSGVTGYKYSDALNEIEGVLIEFLEPKLNKQGGRLKAAKEYFQVPLDDAGTTLEILGSSIRSIEAKLEKLAKAK